MAFDRNPSSKQTRPNTFNSDVPKRGQVKNGIAVNAVSRILRKCVSDIFNSLCIRPRIQTSVLNIMPAYITNTKILNSSSKLKRKILTLFTQQAVQKDFSRNFPNLSNRPNRTILPRKSIMNDLEGCVPLVSAKRPGDCKRQALVQCHTRSILIRQCFALLLAHFSQHPFCSSKRRANL